jgi:hypothetical protein
LYAQARSAVNESGGEAGLFPAKGPGRDGDPDDEEPGQDDDLEKVLAEGVSDPEPLEEVDDMGERDELAGRRLPVIGSEEVEGFPDFHVVGQGALLKLDGVFINRGKR